MVALARRGTALRTVAATFGVAPSTVLYWIQRAGTQRLDRADWTDRKRGPLRPANKVSAEWEDVVLTVRHALKERSALGEWGAQAIHRTLQERGLAPLLSVRTIGRILLRRGALDARRRVRRPAPPAGWYLPPVAAGDAELDSFDVIEGLVIRGGTDVEVLTGTSLHGGLVMARPDAAISARLAQATLQEHWGHVGMPDYAQFDNDTRFQGPHQHPDTLGRVTRFCLSLNIVPVFVPPQETGFQAAIENLNGRWQAKVWTRFHHESLAALQARSHAYITALRGRSAARLETAPARRPFPRPWQVGASTRPQGRVIFLRRTTEQGTVTMLGHRFPVDRHWLHRLVRAEVDLDLHRIRFYALRRREPTWQPLLQDVPYHFPDRPFRY